MGRSTFDYAGVAATISSRGRLDDQLTSAYVLTRSYDARWRISSITYPAPDNETIQYGYDNNGNLGSVTRVGGACYAAFSDYNAAGQPGNIQFYNGASTLLEYYPSNNRLRSVTTNANDLVQEIRYTVYDKNGNVKSIEDGSERAIKQSGNSTTIYIGGLFEDKDGVKVKHIFAGDRRIVSRIDTAAYYYHPDHLGGLSVITNSGGNVAQKAAYYPFGQQIDPGVETDPLPYRFTGQELDTETGLYYYKSRYYDPMIGRFISPDPLIQAAFDPPTFPRLIGFQYGSKEAPILALASQRPGDSEVSLNPLTSPFSYVFNNPLNKVDPMGLKPGDIYLFTKTEGYARYIGWASPGGWYGHALIELTDNRFLSAEGKGVVIDDLWKALNGAKYDVLRPKNEVNVNALEAFAYWAKYYNSDGYHWTGALGGMQNKSFAELETMVIGREYYCSEITWWASKYSGNDLGNMGTWISPNELSFGENLYKLMLGDLLGD
ncbi:MAG: RHS repeat domain-containing protein [Syntrophobacteraceae bacterium]